MEVKDLKFGSFFVHDCQIFAYKGRIGNKIYAIMIESLVDTFNDNLVEFPHDIKLDNLPLYKWEDIRCGEAFIYLDTICMKVGYRHFSYATSPTHLKCSEIIHAPDELFKILPDIRLT